MRRRDQLRRARRHVPFTLAASGAVLILLAVFTDSKLAWGYSACAYGFAWHLRGWAKITWTYDYEGHTASGSASTVDKAVRNITAIHAEWTDR